MWYMGGKFRQSKAICQVLKPYVTPDATYVEPFCGGMWSASRVAKELHPGKMILNDTNKPLMLLWDKCLKDGCDWLPVDAETVEREYQGYKSRQDDADPLTAWYGIALSFGGKWFGGVARNSRIKRDHGYESQRTSTAEKTAQLREVRSVLCNTSYDKLWIPDGAVVYLDPPYEGRVKAHHFDTFDYQKFWQWARDLSKRCTVFVSCFECPDDFEVVYDWGDTVVRHHAGHGSDGTHEKLVRYVVKEV